jgi:hypothetical protein
MSPLARRELRDYNERARKRRLMTTERLGSLLALAVGVRTQLAVASVVGVAIWCLIAVNVTPIVPSRARTTPMPCPPC